MISSPRDSLRVTLALTTCVFLSFACSKKASEKADNPLPTPVVATARNLAPLPTIPLPPKLVPTSLPPPPPLPRYMPESMPTSGPIHRGLAVASEGTLKGRVIAISPDGLSVVTIAFGQENTAYIEAVFAGGKWDGEVIHSNYRIKGAAFDRTQEKVMLAVDHIPNIPEPATPHLGNPNSSFYLYDLKTKTGTFLPLDTDKFFYRTSLLWSVDSLVDVDCENGSFVVNLDALTIRPAMPEDRKRRESTGPKAPPLIFKDGFIGQSGWLTSRPFPGGAYFVPGVIWKNAVAVSDRDRPIIYYFKIEQPYWPWGGSARLSAGTADMPDDIAALDKYLAQSGYSGDDTWARPPVVAEIYRPKINPLNGRAVGADTNAKVAEVRLTKKDAQGVGFIIDRSFLAAKEGDVIANIRNTDTWARDWKSPEGFYLEIVRLEH